MTADGNVFTWGHNSFGQLGLKDEKTVAVRRPTFVTFEAGNFISDIACGFNHCLALTDRGELYVWGSRMGVYPNVELHYDYLKSNMNLLSIGMD